MAFAVDLYRAVAELRGISAQGAEKYGTVLRHLGIWSPSKRGRGATPLEPSDYVMYMLAILSEGPNSLDGFVVRHGNLVSHPGHRNTNIYQAVADHLGLRRHGLYQFVLAILERYRDESICDLVHYDDEFQEKQCLPETDDCPSVVVSISGPKPAATISFCPSGEFLKRYSIKEKEFSGTLEISFVNELCELILKPDTEDISRIYDAIETMDNERHSIHDFSHSFGGEMFTLCANLMRGNDFCKCRKGG